MNKLIISLFIFFSSTAFADLEYDKSFDLGVAFSPSFTPEGGYAKSQLRFGVDIGYSFFKYQYFSPLGNDNFISSTSYKVARIGLGVISNQPVATFSPFAVHVQDRLYFSPTFGFGKSPHTIFTISYELIP